jgi:hypothetical protein
LASVCDLGVQAETPSPPRRSCERGKGLKEAELAAAWKSVSGVADSVAAKAVLRGAGSEPIPKSK